MGPSKCIPMCMVSYYQVCLKQLPLLQFSKGKTNMYMAGSALSHGPAENERSPHIYCTDMFESLEVKLRGGQVCDYTLYM